MNGEGMMRLARRVFLLALVATASACNWWSPPLQVVPVGGGVIVDVQTLGEYMTSVSRIRISDDGGRVIWDVRARGRAPQIWTVKLRCGSNSVFVPDYPAYEVFVPKSTTFVLHPKATYIVQVWDPDSLFTARASFSLDHCI